MRFESVTAHSFGPFSSETLELAPGMTVVYGPNEAGKSTWHAALYAGLCGIRRGRGGSKDDQNFKARHQPWAGGPWKVSTVISLDDGRHIELSQDLAGKAACRVIDIDQGRDYSDEVMLDGSPDGSVWLGLNRKSFLSTACIRQAEIQSVTESVADLQEYLQKAAATAGTDGSAAEAIQIIDKFKTESVGLDRANSRRPLRTAKDRLKHAQNQLGKAQTDHNTYLRLQGDIEDLQASRDVAQEVLLATELAHARKLAQEKLAWAGRARELSDRLEQPEVTQEGGMSPQTIRGLADDLTRSDPVIDPTLEQRRGAAQQRIDSIQQVQSQTPQGGLLARFFRFVLRLLGSLIGRRQSSLDPGILAEAFQELKEAEDAIGDLRFQLNEVKRVKEAARNSAEQHGLPTDPQSLRAVARRLDEGTQQRRDAQTELRTLLDGRTLDDLELDASQLAQRKEELEKQLPASRVAPRGNTEWSLQIQREAVAKAEDALAEKRGRFREFSDNMDSVAEAEERVADAEAELERVQKLGKTLDTTRQLLGHAQDKIHRDVAPKLRRELEPWIDGVTGGRYQRLTVDAQTLAIRVSSGDGEWREAQLLSHGTTELIYLLLRVAVSRFLTQNGETTPLILDDVTVHCDHERQLAMLSLLHGVSREQQIVLFTQEPETLEWAEANLVEDRDRLKLLDPTLVRA